MNFLSFIPLLSTDKRPDKNRQQQNEPYSESSFLDSEFRNNELLKKIRSRDFLVSSLCLLVYLTYRGG